MKQLIYQLIAVLTLNGACLADGGDIPTLGAQRNASMVLEEDSITITFGPIDLPVHHEGELAASLPQRVIEIPQDLYITGFKAAVFSQDGTSLPKEYLHHMLLIDTQKESLACPGESYFLLGAGMEMSEAHFPKGYGIKQGKGNKLVAVVAFYHDVPVTKGVMAALKLWVAPGGTKLIALDSYHVGVNVGCYTRLDQREKGETDEGILLQPGLQVKTAIVKFLVDGCVKYAYPHAHDNVVLLTLEDVGNRRTLLRSVPNVSIGGSLLEFPTTQIYSDPVGFKVSTRESYRIVMVYHVPLAGQKTLYGMGNYLMYLTLEGCEEFSDGTGR